MLLPHTPVSRTDTYCVVEGANSDCTYLSGVHGSAPVARDPPSSSRDAPTPKTGRVVGESCTASCQTGYRAATATYRCEMNLQYTATGAAIACVKKVCTNLPSTCVASVDAPMTVFGHIINTYVTDFMCGRFVVWEGGIIFIVVGCGRSMAGEGAMWI